jgi:hypothetical protein
LDEGINENKIRSAIMKDNIFMEKVQYKPERINAEDIIRIA